ncbi:hypothetical protein [Methylorubrum extorquens]
MAADKNSITDADGTRPIETFQNLSGRATFTLTRREADLVALANPGIRPPQSLEDVHPWLPFLPFVNDSVVGYQVLTVVERRYGKHLVTAATFCDEKWNTICNSVRRKGVLDARFYGAWHLPIQDVFALEERRPHRSVVAIDVNAMYSACMQDVLPKPSALRHVSLDRALCQGETLRSGIYRCRLMRPTTDFIKNHNPFRTFFSGRRLLASLAEPIEVDLNDFEVAYYSRHFDVIHLIDAVVAKETIVHPLAKEARRSFARRQAYQTQGNKALADREKYLATLLSSCASRPNRVRCSFAERFSALERLEEDYGIRPGPDEPEAAMDTWLQRGKGVMMNLASDRVIIDAANLRDGSACFLFGQRIVARGRIHLLQLMEYVLGAGPDIRICYVNIDSIHFSVPNKHLKAVMGVLQAKASDKMGSFKIEAVTRHGLWLEPGRYWLYSGKVEKFRNRSVGDRLRPFKDYAVHVAIRRISGLHVPVRASIQMDKSMSHARSIVAGVDEDFGIELQKQVETSRHTKFADVLDALERNRNQATNRRLEAFGDLRRRLDQPWPAATGQGCAPSSCRRREASPIRGVFEEHSQQEQSNRADPAPSK